MARHQDNARERILDGFEDVLITGGDAQVTLEGVAAHVGLTKGGLLYHFASKQDLLVGLATEWLERFRRAVLDAVDPADGSPGRLVRAYVQVSIDEEPAGDLSFWMLPAPTT